MPTVNVIPASEEAAASAQWQALTTQQRQAVLEYIRGGEFAVNFRAPLGDLAVIQGSLSLDFATRSLVVDFAGPLRLRIEDGTPFLELVTGG